MFHFIQLCSTLFNFIQLCSSLFNFVQHCSTLRSYAQILCLFFLNLTRSRSLFSFLLIAFFRHNCTCSHFRWFFFHYLQVILSNIVFSVNAITNNFNIDFYFVVYGVFSVKIGNFSKVTISNNI